jgi:competence protein ComFB
MMDIHNNTEDLVITEVNTICDSFANDAKQKGICTCKQCRIDAICYVLNRAEPRYVVSHRGVARLEPSSKVLADITALAYEGIRRVSHNQRLNFKHEDIDDKAEAKADTPYYNIPTIIGRVFNGLNFSPMPGVTVELLENGVLTIMKDNNWQNPYTLITNTGGTFNFLPKPVSAEKFGTRQVFEYTIRIAEQGFDEINHVFSIPVTSEPINMSFSLSRTYKLADLFFFPTGDDKTQLALND